MQLDLYEFETTEAAVDVSGGGEAGAAPSPEAGEAVPPPAAATDAAPAWTPDDPTFRDAVAQEADAVVAARLAEFQQQQYQQQQSASAPNDGPPEYDPFDPDSVRAYMAWERQQTINAIDQRLAPVAQTFEQQQQAANDDLLRDAISDAITRTGDLDADDHARGRIMQDVRDRYFPEAAARYGVTDRAAETAIERAVAAERTYQKSIADAAVERYKNQIGTLAGVRGEPGAGAGPGVETFSDRPMSPKELALKFGAKANALR